MTTYDCSYNNQFFYRGPVPLEVPISFYIRYSNTSSFFSVATSESDNITALYQYILPGTIKVETDTSGIATYLENGVIPFNIVSDGNFGVSFYNSNITNYLPNLQAGTGVYLDYSDGQLSIVSYNISDGEPAFTQFTLVPIENISTDGNIYVGANYKLNYNGNQVTDGNGSVISFTVLPELYSSYYYFWQPSHSGSSQGGAYTLTSGDPNSGSSTPSSGSRWMWLNSLNPQYKNLLQTIGINGAAYPANQSSLWLTQGNILYFFTNSVDTQNGYAYNYASTNGIYCGQTADPKVGYYGICLEKTCAFDYDTSLKTDNYFPYSCNPKDPTPVTPTNWGIIIISIIVVIVVIIIIIAITVSAVNMNKQTSTKKKN